MPFRGSFSIFIWISFPVALSLGASSSSFVCLALFFVVDELSFLDMRASSPLMYFSAFASTSAMLAWGFLEMENIKSFDWTPKPAMNAVIANFSLGTSTFKDSALNLCT